MTSTTNEPETSSYVYKPLSGPQHIRVLVLEPSSDHDAPLHFTFHQASLSVLEGNYEAISYTWGKPLLSYPLHSVDDDGQIFVTENLDRGLRRIRHRLDQSWLWADAVCINQRDQREKAVQIPLMAKIYQGAKRTIAWLGSGNEQLEDSMRFLGHFSRQLPEGISMYDKKDDLAAMSKLLTLPYFSRLWIIQELAFSMDITIMCGTTEMSWLRFSTTLSALSQDWVAKSTLMLQIHLVELITGVWQERMGMKQKGVVASNEILHLIEAFSAFGCADPRDRIFALYSMARDIKPSHMEDKRWIETKILMDVDYSRDILTTYKDFARACMLKGKTKEILIAALTRLDITESRDWPCWIPDWRVQPNRQPFYLPAVSYGGKQFGSSIQIQVADLWPPSWAAEVFSTRNMDATACIKISTRGATLPGSFSAYIRSVIDFYKATGTDVDCAPVGLYLVLSKLWKNPDISPKELADCLSDYWDLDDQSETKDLAHHEEALAARMRKITGSSQFFLATPTNMRRKDKTFCFIYGDSSLEEGDRLVISDHLVLQTQHHNIYGAVVVRVVGTIGPLMWPDIKEEQSVYRLVGRAEVLVAVKTGSSTIRHGWKCLSNPTTLCLS